MDKKKIKEFFADKKNRRFAGLSALTRYGYIIPIPSSKTMYLLNVTKF